LTDMVLALTEKRIKGMDGEQLARKIMEIGTYIIERGKAKSRLKKGAKDIVNMINVLNDAVVVESAIAAEKAAKAKERLKKRSTAATTMPLPSKAPKTSKVGKRQIGKVFKAARKPTYECEELNRCPMCKHDQVNFELPEEVYLSLKAINKTDHMTKKASYDTTPAKDRVGQPLRYHETNRILECYCFMNHNYDAPDRGCCSSCRVTAESGERVRSAECKLCLCLCYANYKLSDIQRLAMTTAVQQQKQQQQQLVPVTAMAVAVNAHHQYQHVPMAAFAMPAPHHHDHDQQLQAALAIVAAGEPSSVPQSSSSSSSSSCSSSSSGGGGGGGGTAEYRLAKKTNEESGEYTRAASVYYSENRGSLHLYPEGYDYSLGIIYHSMMQQDLTAPQRKTLQSVTGAPTTRIGGVDIRGLRATPVGSRFRNNGLLSPPGKHPNVLCLSEDVSLPTYPDTTDTTTDTFTTTDTGTFTNTDTGTFANTDTGTFTNTDSGTFTNTDANSFPDYSWEEVTDSLFVMGSSGLEPYNLAAPSPIPPPLC
jgi:hypothetical protein